jgi:hypothetical protein
VRAIQACNKAHKFEMSSRSKGNLPEPLGRCKLRDRPGRWRTAKWTVRKLGMTIPVVVHMMHRTGLRSAIATKLHRKRRTVRRHETQRHVGTER